MGNECLREYFKALNAQFIKENLQQVNIDLKIEFFNWKNIEKMHNGEHEIALIG